ncbi:MAG: FlgD immunoglobulin-like domain containing protein [Candidatus Eisenbacteria bacterium]|nr:FlgD immunoglobulin-like domain containing protein [Candidatus Eisenbacteria bacterium]
MNRKLLVVMAALATLGGSAEAAKVSQVYISEVSYNPVGPNGANQKIELVNLGATVQTLNPWSICIQFLYKNFPIGASIPAGGRYTIHVNKTGVNTPTEWYTGIAYVNIDSTSDGISMYHTTSGFGTFANIEDYVQFGAGGQPRENVGVAAGFWTAGTFVPLGLEGQSVQFVPAGMPPATRHPISDYCNAPPTLGTANSCGPPPMGTLDDLLISEILHNPVGPEAGMTAVEVVSTSSLPVSLDGLTLSTQSTSFTVPNGLTVPGGGVILINLNGGAGSPRPLVGPRAAAPPELLADLVIEATPYVDLIPEAGALSLYRNILDFNDPANMVDFLQWGGGGQALEDVAVQKGIWTAGEFFPEVLEGSSIQWRGTGDGNSPSEFYADTPSLGTVNPGSSSGTPGVRPGGAVLAANRPNPFNGTTLIRFVTTRPEPDASLTVFDLSGRPIRRLFEGALAVGVVEMSWDSRDDSGSMVPAGIYFYRLRTAAGTKSRKMTVFR